MNSRINADGRQTGSIRLWRPSLFSYSLLLPLLVSFASINVDSAVIEDSRPAPRTIALSIDDLPMTVVRNDHIAGPLAETQEIMQMLVKQLRAHSAPAIGFVNEVKLNVQGERDARVALLEEWLNANLLLGNHGYNHLKLA